MKTKAKSRKERSASRPKPKRPQRAFNVKTILQSLCLCAMLLFAATPARAANYEFRPMTIANGGGTSAGWRYSFTHTLGQQTLGRVSGGRYSEQLGFWNKVTATTPPLNTYLQVIHTPLPMAGNAARIARASAYSRHAPPHLAKSARFSLFVGNLRINP